MRTTPKATAGLWALTPGSKPLFHRRGAWPRVVFFAAVIICVLVPAFAIVLADRYARDAVTAHERVVANDIVASVDRILDGVRLPAGPAGGSTMASQRWPFTVSVIASARYAAQVQRHYRLICATIVLLADSLVMAAYLLAMAPRRLLLKAVRHALRRNEFHVVYQPIVDVQTRRTVGV
ncbi:cyclic diguanylate phosphodiesterase, partial [Burkholderia cenocepacia]|nr:cyclic diguanylate phosphodiesterase [Burkholderia cenocepacia]MDR5667980.1 cyclic diguanylate phosphodiesterase [Burkholderia cenocepacia]